jgi:hypothetical protein
MPSRVVGDGATGIEPVTSGLQSREEPNDRWRRSNARGLKSGMASGVPPDHALIKVVLG